jgi:hypothetical protein
MTSKRDVPITNLSDLPASLPEIVEPNIRRHGGGSNKHPLDLKLRAILLTAQQGAAAAAKDTGVPLRTVQDWALEAKNEIATIRSAQFAEELDQKISDILKEIDPDKIKDAKFRDLLVGLGIALDKRQQLLGPQKNQEPHRRLRIVWTNNAGAVEIED